MTLSIGGYILEALDGFDRPDKTEDTSYEMQDADQESVGGSNRGIKSEQFSGEATVDTVKLEEEAWRTVISGACVYSDSQI